MSDHEPPLGARAGELSAASPFVFMGFRSMLSASKVPIYGEGRGEGHSEGHGRKPTPIQLSNQPSQILKI